MEFLKTINSQFETDVELIKRFAACDPLAVRLVTERHNQRLFRTAWAVLKNRAEAEDSVQSAYLRAFALAKTFEGRSSLTTWLTKIVINEALCRRRAAKRRLASLDGTSVAVLDEYREKMMRGSMTSLLQDGSVARDQIRLFLEAAIAKLPEPFRLVFVLRELEGLSVDEVAETLSIPSSTVKTRALRARQRLQQTLAPEVKEALSGVFPFAGAECSEMTARIIGRYKSNTGAETHKLPVHSNYRDRLLQLKLHRLRGPIQR